MTRDLRRLRARAASAAFAVVVPSVLAGSPAVSYGSVGPAGGGNPAVIGHRVIGESVQGRPIHAWHLGNPEAARTVVAMAVMHGDEPAPRRTLLRLRDGAPIRGVNLWVVPAMNPDGLARHSRYNANGVDLNRNFPVNWTREPHHGPRPASAPETRSVMRFLGNIRPERIVSFHQPLFGVDIAGSKAPAFARRLSEALRLPRKRFTCGSGCHGTMTQWYNRRFAGACVTVEYSRSPSERYVTRFAPRALLRAVGGSR
jgi:murein peptide amidase A